jgi:SAM-dependent methyltransferase
MVSHQRFDKDYFNGQGSNYRDYLEMDNDYYWSRRLQPLLRYAQNGRLLELGCAYGFFLKRARHLFNVFGIDLSEYALEQARKNLSDFELKACDLNHKLPFSESEFDVIVSFDTLEHVENIAFCVEEISRVLREGGFFAFQVPIKNMVMKLFRFLDMDEAHVSVTSEEAILSLLSRNNLSPIMKRYLLIISPKIEIWSGKKIAKHLLPQMYCICQKKS